MKKCPFCAEDIQDEAVKCLYCGERLDSPPVLSPQQGDSVIPAELEYVGFWARVGASLIDTILLCIVIWPLLYAIYGPEYWSSDQFFKGLPDFLLSWVLPAIVIIVFWVKAQATPGKMFISARIVDAKDGGKPSTGQMLGRYFAYFISALPLCFGFIWVAFDRRKQGWHDKLAGTVVVHRKSLIV